VLFRHGPLPLSIWSHYATARAFREPQPETVPRILPN